MGWAKTSIYNSHESADDDDGDNFRKMIFDRQRF